VKHRDDGHRLATLIEDLSRHHLHRERRAGRRAHQ
jgi:hypothetical protein